MCRCSNGRSAPQTATFGDSCDTLVVSVSTSRLRPNLSPRRGCPVSSGSLAPQPPAQMGRGGPKSAILTCCAPGGASIRAAWAIYGRDGLQGVPASLLERSEAPTPPGRTQMRVVYAFFEVYINFGENINFLLPGGGSDPKNGKCSNLGNKLAQLPRAPAHAGGRPVATKNALRYDLLTLVFTVFV